MAYRSSIIISSSHRRANCYFQRANHACCRSTMEMDYPKYPHYENVGVEDMTFEGKAKVDFTHHGSWEDDGAYKPINLIRLTNSWMRRVGFRSVSEASSIVNSSNVSVYDVVIDGNRGHAAIRSQASSRVFIGKVTDKSNGFLIDNKNVYEQGAGQYHACGVSKQSIGAVIWNVDWGN